MALTPQQLVTLKAYIDADPTLSAYPVGSDGSVAIAALLNADSAPAYIVWRSNVSITDVGEAFNGGELAGLTTGNQSRLQTLALYLANGVNPSKSGVRDFFDDVFSGAGGQITRANLLALWKRTATRGEAIFASGSGTDGSPSTLVVEGAIPYQDVQRARELS